MKDETYIVFVLDASGSMEPLTKDVIGSVKTFIEDQKTIGDNFKVLTYQFNSEVKKLDIKNYSARGSTALLDAVCFVIDEVGQELADKLEQDRPNKVAVVIMTDGQENSSVHYDIQDVRERVKRQSESYKWEFVFLGANIDSFATGGSLGFSATTTRNYEASSVGIRSAIDGLSKSVVSYRRGNNLKI